MKQQFQQFLLAVQFLTRLPVGRWIIFQRDDLPRSAKYFPLVGALVGAISAVVFVASEKILPVYLAIVWAMLANVIVTGGLHEDGFADTADGLSGATRERMLEIMRDSRLGTFGALALWFSLMMKFLALQWLAAFGIPLWPALIAAPVLSRCAGVLLLATCKNVRADSPTSGPFSNAAFSARQLTFAILSAVVLAILLLRKAVVLTALFAAVLTTGCRAFFQRRLGGITGDCLGATIHLVEVAIYLLLVATAKIVISHRFPV